MEQIKKNELTIILVHGAWGDGSHWKEVIPTLTNAGYKVRAVQNPLTSLADDVQKTKELIDSQDSKVLLVGHSYGGAVISLAGNHEKVAGLVYISAFAPDDGESLEQLLAKKPTSGIKSIVPDSKGFLWIRYEEFKREFCSDVNDRDALVMSLSQKAINSECLSVEINKPSWKNLPVWYQVSTHDKMIHPDTQREMSVRMNPVKVIELESSHASIASKAKEVSNFIIDAASSLS